MGVLVAGGVVGDCDGGAVGESENKPWPVCAICDCPSKSISIGLLLMSATINLTVAYAPLFALTSTAATIDP